MQQDVSYKISLSQRSRKSRGCVEHQDESDRSRGRGEGSQDQALASQWASGEHMQLGRQKDQIVGDDTGIQQYERLYILDGL